MSYFPERRLALVEVVGENLRVRRYVEKQQDVEFSIDVSDVDVVGYESTMKSTITDILKMEPNVIPPSKA